jgi:hypothetical protein
MGIKDTIVYGAAGRPDEQPTQAAEKSPTPSRGWFRRNLWAMIAATALFFVGVAIGETGGSAPAVTHTVAGPTVTHQTTVTAPPVTHTRTVTHTRIKVIVRTPPNAGVSISYGQWAGLFKLTGAHIVNDGYGDYSVDGQFEYLGGGTCKLGYVEVSGTFFHDQTITDSSGLWNTETAPKGVRLPFNMGYSGQGSPTRAALVVTDARCK